MVKKWLLLCSMSALVLLFCAELNNPLDDPHQASSSIIVKTNTDRFNVGDSIHVGIITFLNKHLKKVEVSVITPDSTIYSTSIDSFSTADLDTHWLFFIPKKTKPHIISIKTHHNSADNFISTVSKEISVYGKSASITKNPGNIDLQEGDLLTISFEATGSDLNYTWYHNNSIISQNQPLPTYIKNNVNLSDSGQYWCIVSNEWGNSVQTEKILVSISKNEIPLTSPSIKSEPNDISITVGQPLNLEVIAEGSAPMSYQWYKNDLPMTGETNSSYKKNSAGESDSGNYYCKVKNSLDSVSTRTVRVTISNQLLPPVITTDLADLAVLEGKPLTLNVTATGTNLQYIWKKNGTILSGFNGPTFSRSVSEMRDSGSYNVLVYNSLDSVESKTSKVTITQQAHMITTTVGAGGKILINDKNVTQSSATAGSSIICKIVPDTGFKISEVLIDGVKDTNAISTGIYTFTTINKNHQISAQFTPILYTLTVSMANGTVEKTPNSSTFQYNASVQLKASPLSGYEFKGWSGDTTVSETTTTLILKMTRNRSLIANFAKIGTYTINVSTLHGKVVRIPDNPYYEYDTKVSLIPVADTGYTFSNWVSNDTSVQDDTINIFVKKSYTLTAQFIPQKFTITASAGIGGTISPSGNVIVNYGVDTTFLFKPSTGFKISEIKIDNTQDTNAAKAGFYKFQKVSKSHTVSAQFTILEFNLNVTCNPVEGIVTGSGKAKYDIEMPITATPTAGWVFKNWTIAGAGAVDATIASNISASTTIKLKSGAVDVKANFERKKFKLTAGGSNGVVVATIDGTAYNNPIDMLVDSGKVVSLEAKPSSNYDFSAWTSGLSGSTPTGTLTITGDKQVSAVFTLKGYGLTLIANPTQAGTVSGGGTITHGVPTAISVTPNAGYRFVKWQILTGTPVIADPLKASTTITLASGSASIEATFSRVKYPLTINATNGTVATEPTGTEFDSGTVVKLTAAANTGYNFKQWSGGITGSLPTANVVLNSAQTITAEFSLKTYELTINNDGNGTTNPTGKVNVNHNTSFAIKANAPMGYRFDSWLIESGSGATIDNPLNASANITLTNGPVSIRATFKRVRYDLVLKTPVNGIIQANPSGTQFDSGTVVQLSALPSGSSYSFKQWGDDVTGNTSPISIVMNGPKTVSAIFSLTQYTLTLQNDGNGTTTPSSPITVNHDVAQQIRAKANLGYKFSKWEVTSGTVSIVNANDTLTDVKVTAGPASVKATFTRIRYTLTLSSTNGTITPSASSGNMVISGNTVQIDSGSSITLTPSPSATYFFANWTGINGITNQNPATFIVNSNLSVTANFTQQSSTPTISPASGTVFNGASQVVTISGPQNSQIFYTTNGTDPTTSTTTKGTTTVSVTLTQSTTVKAIVLESNKTPSQILTANYIKNLAPSVTISSPTNGQILTEGTNLTISLNASDPDAGGSIQSARIWVDNNPITTSLNGGVWSGVWPSKGGLHTISAEVTDNNGAISSKATVQVKVKGWVAVTSSALTGSVPKLHADLSGNLFMSMKSTAGPIQIMKHNNSNATWEQLVQLNEFSDLISISRSQDERNISFSWSDGMSIRVYRADLNISGEHVFDNESPTLRVAGTINNSGEINVNYFVDRGGQYVLRNLFFQPISGNYEFQSKTDVFEDYLLSYDQIYDVSGCYKADGTFITAAAMGEYSDTILVYKKLSPSQFSPLPTAGNTLGDISVKVQSDIVALNDEIYMLVIDATAQGTRILKLNLSSWSKVAYKNTCKSADLEFGNGKLYLGSTTGSNGSIEIYNVLSGGISLITTLPNSDGAEHISISPISAIGSEPAKIYVAFSKGTSVSVYYYALY